MEHKIEDDKKKIESLRGFYGIIEGETVTRTPDIFKENYPDDKSKWPEFDFLPLDGVEYQKFTESVGRDSVGSPKFSTEDRKKLLGGHLTGWRTLKSPNGTDVPYTDDPEKKIRVLSPILQTWAMSEILLVSQADPVEETGLKS